MGKRNGLQDDFDFQNEAIATGVMDERGRKVVSRKRDPERRPGQHCKRVVKIVLKQIGLSLLLIGYLIGGGYLFRELEVSNEYSECMQKSSGYVSKLNFSAARVIGFVEAQEDKDLTGKMVREAMVDFAEQLFILDFQPRTNCSLIKDTSYGANWNLANSIYFCATIITTIGYGHIAPSTYWGRISCIIYALIGIPMMLLYLAIIGKGLARAFRLIYVNLICCRCFYDVFRRKRQKRRERLLKWEQDLRLHEEEEARRRGLPVPPAKVQAIIMDDSQNELDDDENDEVVAVPLTVSIVLLASYTMIGAFIFTIWEDWTLIDSLYFSFITISTVGFGDLVPGAGRLQNTETIVELIVGSLYILFGFALLSMSFNLLQTEILSKFQYIARCCGGSNDDEDEHDEKDDKKEEEEEEEQEEAAGENASEPVGFGMDPMDEKPPYDMGSDNAAYDIKE